jgi:hypothetical protein
MDVLKPLYDTTNLLQINAQNNLVNLQQAYLIQWHGTGVL